MNVRFIHKILLLILLPLIALTLLLGRSVLSEYQHAERLQALESEVKLTTFNSLLVHELQKERGATSGWLGSGTQAFADKLNRQRKLTDQALQRWQSHLQGSRAFSPEIRNILDNVRRQLSRLDSIRNNADLHNIELGKALGYYTDLNADLLSIAATTSSLSDNADIARHAAAFFAFLQAKERAGIERAVLSNVFSSDHFAPGLYPRFINLVSEQGTYLDLFRVMATAEQGLDLDRLEASAAFKAVAQLRRQAHDRALDGGFGVAGTLWFDRATERINAMKAFEDRLAATLLNLAETAHTGAVRQIWFSALSLLGILLLVGIVSLWIIRGLHRQVDTLATTMNRVRNEQDLTVRARVLSRDELGVVAEQLNHTLDTFTSAIREVATSSKQLSSEADNTSQIVLQAEQSLKLQSDETMQVAAAVEEVSTAIQDVANSTASASDAAYQAETLVQHGHEKVRAAVTAVASLANDSKHLAEMTARLNDSSLRISDVTGVISNVSEQTNLLALNAAIEAARAGEHGRGFAVVADEVRTLAQRTQASTSEIDDIIRRLQQETQEAINLVESNQKDMSVATERAREVENALDAIVAAIDNITNMSTQIAAAAEEESTAISDIGRNIAGIDTSAEAISDSARVLSEHARQQLQMAQQLNQMIQRFKT